MFMQTMTQSPLVSKTMLRIGYGISTFAVLVFLLDGATKVLKIPQVVQANLDLGYQESHVVGIGILMLVCTLVYIIPQTSVLGAILLTAYLGGAVATHVRAGSPLFPIIFTITFGLLVWLGLYLREPRLHVLVPLRKAS
jgi:ABC-type Fe3+-siderophore transport system permease subunit